MKNEKQFKSCFLPHLAPHTWLSATWSGCFLAPQHLQPWLWTASFMSLHLSPVLSRTEHHCYKLCFWATTGCNHPLRTGSLRRLPAGQKMSGRWMPSGLTNAPAVFQALVNYVFKDFLNHYRYSNQNLSNHKSHVFWVLQRLLELQQRCCSPDWTHLAINPSCLVCWGQTGSLWTKKYVHLCSRPGAAWQFIVTYRPGSRILKPLLAGSPMIPLGKRDPSLGQMDSGPLSYPIETL